MASKNIKKSLEIIERTEKALKVKKIKLIEQAAHGDNVPDIIKANSVLNDITPREDSNRKSYLVDPFYFNASLGYKDKPYSLSYFNLKRMAKTPVINAIIKTRKNQIAAFAEPQRNKYATGFVIKKKMFPGQKPDEKLTRTEEAEVYNLTEFILNCGRVNKWEGDDFDTFIRKYVDDSLSIDQATFEIVRDRRGKPYEFFATDGSTMRIADSYDDEDYKKLRGDRIAKIENAPEVKGYLPSYVQVFDSRVSAEYYPWELCFGIRGAKTNVLSNGYGYSEIEELTTIITSLLWGEEYNRKFFSQGSAPKGFLRFKNTTLNPERMKEFKQSWQAMISGVTNAWKTPIIEGEVDWIDLQKGNRDMEFSHWIEFLIKISCAIFTIDPAEINFPLSGGTDQKAMFEGNNEARIKHSKDKGLYPILKHIQARINKYILQPLNPKYEFLFVGLDGSSVQEELEMDIKRLSNFMTPNEIRDKHGLPPIEGGDIILNAVYAGAQAQEKQMKMYQEQGGEPGQPENGEEDEEADEDKSPISKAFDSYLKKLQP